MSLNKKVQQALEIIGSVSITTLDKETMHSRIISICGCDEENIYFLTMVIKPFYRQLKKNPNLALCGIYPSGHKSGKNEVGQPRFEPGFALRLSGEAREIHEDEVKEKADAGSEIHNYFLEDAARYPATRFFCINKGKGEIFDYDFELEHRDYKLLRTRFAFGGETFNGAGARINPDTCIACGECFDVCTFKAIIPGEPYRVDGFRCDECGSCFQICPQEAIEVSLTI
ncbi:4Fe-4S ferredoxin iron-sulfur binding domain protein [Desulfamplus magnetovallimortis]|uniref:4Fe-4S ferredoxin iron-sulfur binding domain protein n=1 Tax=Desulfamplus magnetovallimortis TaxID=1246637 RepID=A0A1W1HAY9_9BACT|nr:4Fe-4S binding protein [Desulfamplus magnetovallimortis]SLM29661.1 4Fe-4S ferredoxin iron-sulfur binding domain protein [Desulfamplus magnetovallimortis]